MEVTGSTSIRRFTKFRASRRPSERWLSAALYNRQVIDQRLDSPTSALQGDWGIEHLIQALLLGEGFGFHILSCDTPRAAQLALRFLESEVGRRLKILHPPAKAEVGRPFTSDELVVSI